MSYRVLIVDDDITIGELLNDGLSQDGYHCEIASTAEEALSKCKTNECDIALVDIMLPNASGLELLGLLQEGSRRTPVIMLTAVQDVDTAVQAMKLGASDYILKPLSIKRLKDRINAALDRDRIINSSLIVPGLNGRISNGAKPDWNPEIEAIAYGVDAQIDSYDLHSKTVTEKTIEIAQRFGLPEKEIENWARARAEFYKRRTCYIQTALSKLERNPLAQVILGLTESIYTQ